MSRCFLLLVLFAWWPSAVATQPLPHPHPHHPGCVSMELWDLPESRDAVAEYRQWIAEGRPGQIRKPLAVAAIGDRRSFKTRDFVNNKFVDVNFELRHSGTWTDIWVEVAEFGQGKVTQAVIDTLASALEQRTPPLSRNPSAGILANNSAVFGPRPNVDGSGRVTMLIHRIVSSVEGSFIAGYFDGTNLSLTNPNSNRADIIYINSTPGIYSANQAPTAANIVSTIAHEDQHLIHARAGALNTFQNEGQSEWAELVNGYTGRSMAYLNAPAQVNQDLFTWRSSSADVLFDYARAGLFHTYLADRIGSTRVGNLSSIGTSGLPAYNSVISGTGLTFTQLLVDFHVANWVNDSSIPGGRFTYSSVQRRSTRALTPALLINNVLREARADRSLRNGAAEYIQWIAVKDLNLALTGSSSIRYHLVTKRTGSGVQVQEITSGTVSLPGEFDEIVLVAVNTGSPATYRFTSTWTPLPVLTQILRYAGPSRFFAELPGDPSNPDRSAFRAYSTRLSPTFAGEVHRVRFELNGGSNAKRGNGTLRVSLFSSTTNGFETGTSIPRIQPAVELRYVSVPFDVISPGVNVLDTRGLGWILEADTDYHIVFEVQNPTADARLEFLIDEGTTSMANPAYYPVRTRIRLTNGNWARWGNANIQLVEATVQSVYEGPLQAPVLLPASVTEFTATIGSPFAIQAHATGIPEPIYIWSFEGSLLAEPGRTLRFNPFQMADAGTYTVRAANLAGVSQPQTYKIAALANEYRLEANYPNPFNPTTTIAFRVVASASVTLEVFDLLGRRVGTVVDPTVFAAGRYERTFDATGLASGVYVIRLRIEPVQSGESVLLFRKMTLLK